LHVPNVIQVVDALAPFVSEERWRLRVRWLYPVGEKVTLLCLIPQVLVKISICDLFQRLDVVNRDKVSVKVHELNSYFLERPVAKKMPLHS